MQIIILHLFLFFITQLWHWSSWSLHWDPQRPSSVWSVLTHLWIAMRRVAPQPAAPPWDPVSATAWLLPSCSMEAPMGSSPVSTKRLFPVPRKPSVRYTKPLSNSCFAQLCHSISHSSWRKLCPSYETLFPVPWCTHSLALGRPSLKSPVLIILSKIFRDIVIYGHFIWYIGKYSEISWF